MNIYRRFIQRLQLNVGLKCKYLLHYPLTALVNEMQQ